MTGTRNGAIGRAEKYFDDGGFLSDLQRRVAIPTTSQEQGSMPALQQYVSGEMTDSLQKLGYACTVQPNPKAEYGPFLIARRVEDPAKPTVLTPLIDAFMTHYGTQANNCMQHLSALDEHHAKPMRTFEFLQQIMQHNNDVSTQHTLSHLLLLSFPTLKNKGFWISTARCTSTRAG